MEHSKKREFSRFEQLAKIIHPARSKTGVQVAPGTTKVVDGASEYNGDPESVAHLSVEDREALTQKLMGMHKDQLKTLKEDPEDG